MKQPKMREGSVLAVVIDEPNQSIVFNVKGAAPDGGSKSITFDMRKVHPNNAAYAALHGFNQRLRDAAALSRNPETGAAPTPADRFAAIERLVEHYHSGAAEWNLRPAAGERVSGETAMLAAAIAELRGKDVGEVRAWLKTKTAAEQKALAVSAAIKPIMDRMREAAAAPVDAEDLLSEI